jgi:hypothetical protein
MTDDQWLLAIAKHNTERGRFDWDHPERGGGEALAAMLHGFVERDPERFAKLALNFPSGTHPSYYMNVLYALKGAAIGSTLKLDVARRVFASEDAACLMAALDLLGAVEDQVLPEDAVLFIQRMALEHSDPKCEEWEGERPLYGGNMLTYGMNTVRGHAAEAIRDLIRCDREYLGGFGEIVEKLVADPSVSVRACVASTLLAMASHDAPRAISLLRKLVEGDDRLLGTNYVVQFIEHGLHDYIAELRPHIERMLSSSNREVCQAGGQLACLARLYHKSADDLAEGALTGSASCRLGAAKVASNNLTHPDCREWCEAALQRLFNDADAKVRQEAAHCFWHFWQQPELSLAGFDSLIRAFLKSNAFADDPTFILHTLEDARRRVPETVLDVCERFVAQCAEKAKDIRTSLAADEHMVSKLAFRAYAQLEAQPLQKRALDLIDRMCAEGFPSVGENISIFER